MTGMGGGAGVATLTAASGVRVVVGISSGLGVGGARVGFGSALGVGVAIRLGVGEAVANAGLGESMVAGFDGPHTARTATAATAK